MHLAIKPFGPLLRRVSVVTWLLFLNTGCSLPTSTAAPSEPGPEPLLVLATPVQSLPRLPARDAVAPLLAYADQLRSLQGAELTQEIARLGEPSGPADQLRLALALSQTRQLYDLVRAQELLQKVLASTSEPALQLQTLARLLAARFVEQRRVEDLLDRQNQQLRELQRRLEQTQEKLDALKEIERSLNKRPASAPAAAPNGRVRP